MAVQCDVGLYKAKPKRLGLCAKQKVILRSASLMFSQPMCGLIDTDYQCIGICFGDERGAHACTAEGIEDQRPVITLPTLKQLLERLPGMRGAGFAPWVVLMVLHNLCEIRMGCHLVCLEDRCSMRRLICLRSVSHLAIIPRYLSLSGPY